MPTKAKRNGAALPNQFVPAFYEQIDKRLAACRIIKERVETLKDHSGADSFQKELLCQRAIFIALQLETMEVNAIENGHLETGVYTQMSNALLGLLKALGLDFKKNSQPWLQPEVLSD